MSFEGDVKKVMDSLETLADDLHLNVEIELGYLAWPNDPPQGFELSLILYSIDQSKPSSEYAAPS